MNTRFFNNDKGEQELEVFSKAHCSRRKFVSILGGLDGVDIIRPLSVFSIYELCTFDFDGYRFRLYLDDWSYSYCFSSPEASQDSFDKLASHFGEYEIYVPAPRPTSKPLVALLLMLLGVAVLFGLYAKGYISG